MTSPFMVPWPALNEAASYHGSKIDIQIFVDPQRPIKDASGAPLGLGLLRVDMSALGGRTHFWQAFDQGGRKVVAFSDCPTVGLGFTTSGACTDAGRAAAVWSDIDLPAGIGGSWFWGKTLDRTARQDFRLFGSPFSANYHVDLEVDDGVSCYHLTSSQEEAAPDVTGQRFSALSAPPSELTICSDSAFPHRVVLPDWGELKLTDHKAGSSSARPDATATSPWDRPVSPDASFPVGGLPPGVDQDPSGFSAAEGFAFARDQTDVGRSFAAAHKPTVLGFSMLTRWSRTTLGLAPAADALDAERSVELTSSDGATLAVELEKKCQLTCSINVTASRSGSDPNSAHPGESIPGTRLGNEANATLGVGYSKYGIGLFVWDNDLPTYPAAGSYHYLFIANDPGKGSLPYTARYDGARDELLSIAADRSVLDRLVYG